MSRAENIVVELPRTICLLQSTRLSALKGSNHLKSKCGLPPCGAISNEALEGSDVLPAHENTILFNSHEPGVRHNRALPIQKMLQRRSASARCSQGQPGIRKLSTPKSLAYACGNGSNSTKQVVFAMNCVAPQAVAYHFRQLSGAMNVNRLNAMITNAEIAAMANT